MSFAGATPSPPHMNHGEEFSFRFWSQYSVVLLFSFPSSFTRFNWDGVFSAFHSLFLRFVLFRFVNFWFFSYCYHSLTMLLSSPLFSPFLFFCDSCHYFNRSTLLSSLFSTLFFSLTYSFALVTPSSLVICSTPSLPQEVLSIFSSLI